MKVLCTTILWILCATLGVSTFASPPDVGTEQVYVLFAFEETIDADLYPARFSLVDTEVTNPNFTVRAWLPTIGNSVDGGWSGDPLFQDSASSEDFWIEYNIGDNLVRLNSTNNPQPDTVYGENYAPTGTGVMTHISGAQDVSDVYAIYAWTNVTGILGDTDGDGEITGLDQVDKATTGVNFQQDRTKLRLDFGTMNYGTLSFVAENLDGSPSTTAEFFAAETGGTALTTGELTYDLTADTIPSYLFVQASVDTNIIAVYNGGTTTAYDYDLDTIKLVVPPEYTITFVAGPNGQIVGTTSQTLYDGWQTESVGAFANPGYDFIRWDSTAGEFSRDNPLTVTAFADLTLTAVFLPQPLDNDNGCRLSGDHDGHSLLLSMAVLLAALITHRLCSRRQQTA